MTDRPFSPDPGQAGPVRPTDDSGFDHPYWQAGYRLGGYDQRIADLREIRTRLTIADHGLDAVEVDRRQQQLDQLQADLLEAENARAAYLDELQEERSALLDDTRVIQEPAAPSADALAARLGSSVSGPETADPPARASGVVRSPRTTDSTHRAHQAHAPVATFRPPR